MISVIIPTCNDEGLIKTTISNLRENSYCRLLKEIIVVDAGSADNTVNEALECGATVVRSIRKARGTQLNLGAHYATGKILYFITPGTLVPKNFTNEIVRATQKGFSFGTFNLRFDSTHWLLNTLSWFTKNKINFARIEGQSLFVVQELFEKAGRFREDLQILEDREFISRLKRYSGFMIIDDILLASTQKLHERGIIRTELTYLIVRFLYGLGYHQDRLVRISKSLLGTDQEQTRTSQALSASLS